MKYLLSSEQMRELDSRTIKECHLSSRMLMETAGKGCADLLVREFSAQMQSGVLILCGNGNNGGDGAVLARWLHHYGYAVTLVNIQLGNLSPETKANFAICQTLGIKVHKVKSDKHLDWLKEMVSMHSMIVDAIFGIGFKGELEPWLKELFFYISAFAEFKVALDIPSGLNADTGETEMAIWVDTTLCIANLKLGHILGMGREICGKLYIVDIGIPALFYGNENNYVRLFTERDFFPPIRISTYHKNDYGKVYIFGGISGYTGASIMAARAALRAGCGYAFVLYRNKLIPIYSIKLTEALYLPIPENLEDNLPDEQALQDILSNATAVLIGPGLGKDEFAYKLLEITLKYVDLPLLIDADGLNILAEHPDLYQYLAKPNVLITPHWGEFIRLAKIEKSELQEDCLRELRAFVNKYQAQVLLKSHFSIFCNREETWVNITGNDGLATGGSGDVLSGIIISFLAQGLSITEAAINASYLLGATAEKLAKKRATASILPTDIIDNLFIKD
ncbi:MAG: NAD(P)H-hydrate dehydratase [Candidatus Syntrophosphaera sp.]|jgi:NAD(P)H-hydrate epimerase|nr:NAD(P)H-hydrate dehydratase [Candidatus Syntrophosphaera sp.]